MNIIEKYIETNKSLLDELVANDPTLGVGVIDALAVLNNYINANNVEFTQEEEDKILVPANIEEIKREQERAENELKLAEERSKEIQQAVQKVDETDLDNILCTYVWVRGGGANLKVNTYFALGVTKGSKAESIFISTYLKNDVFTSNPTPQNKLVRDVFISTGRLKYEDIGVWTWNLSSSVMKSTDVKDLLDNRNFIGGYTNKVIAISEATKPSLIPRLLIDKTRRGAIELLTQGTNGVLLNKKQYVFDYIRALKNPYLLDIALNTLQMVAWAEGITLGLRTTTDFMDLASYYNDVIRDSKADNQRLYLILSRDTTASADAELSSAFGSSLAQGIVQSKGENNAFVVGILVDGAFQNDIDPYMFSQPVAQSTTAQIPILPFTPESLAKADAMGKSLTNSDNVYVIKKQDDAIVVEEGEDEAYKIIWSPDFDSVVAIFKDGKEISLPILPPPTQAVQSAVSEDDLPILEDEDITIDIDDLNDLEDLEDLEDLDLSDLDFEINEQE